MKETSHRQAAEYGVRGTVCAALREDRAKLLTQRSDLREASHDTVRDTQLSYDQVTTRVLE
eukprot:5314645-Pyramimonas_sp.AAC.1